MKRPYFKAENSKEIAKEVHNKNFEDARITVDMLEYVARNCYRYSDGYELAKKIEDSYYVDIDTMIVEMLDYIPTLVGREQDRLERQWVKDNGVEPLLKIGCEVSYQRGSEVKTGTIDGINLEVAKYYVTTDKPSARAIIEYEKVL